MFGYWPWIVCDGELNVDSQQLQCDLIASGSTVNDLLLLLLGWSL